MSDTEVHIPGRAIATDATDIGDAAEKLLRHMQLLPTPDELARADGFSATFGGPPQSVAVIEAGATAFSKWWAAGLGAAVAATAPAVSAFWNRNNTNTATQRVLLVGVAIALSAVVLAIGYIVGSDVRGRSATAIATVQARAKIADTMARLAEQAYRPAPVPSNEQIVGLPAMPATHLGTPPDEQPGWIVIALKRVSDDQQYLMVKGPRHEWVDQNDVLFPHTA